MKRFNFLLFCIIPFLAEAQNLAPAHEGQVTSITFTKDNSLILTGGSDKKIRVWNSHTGEMLYVTDCEMVPQELFISPDNNSFIATNKQKDHLMYDLETGERIGEIEVDEVLGFTPDGKNIITAVYGDDGFNKFAALGFATPDDIYDTRYFSQSRIYYKDKLRIPRVTSDGGSIFLATGEEKVLLFHENDPFAEEEIRLPVKADQIALHGSDSIMAVSGSAAIIDMDNFKVSRNLQQATIGGPDADLWFSGSGSYLISKNRDKLLVFKVEDGSLIGNYHFDGADVIAADDEAIRVAYTRDKNLVIVENLLSRSEKKFLEAPDIKEKWGFQDYLRGVYYYRKGNYKKALDYFLSCEGKSPKITKLYFLRGECFFKIGNLQQAMMDFLTDHEAVPGRSSLQLARIFAWKGHPQEAKKWLDSNRVSPFKVSVAQLKNDKYLKDLFQEGQFNAIVSKEWQTEGESLALESKRRIKNNEPLAALEFINKAILKEPSNPSYYRERGFLYLKLHEMEKARKDFMKEAELNPAVKSESYQAVALTYSHSAEYFNAIVWIKKSIQVDASCTENLIDIAEIYQAGYRRDLAISTLNDYLDVMPDDYYAYYLRATMNVLAEGKLADITKAIDLCREQGDPVPAQFHEVLENVDAEAKIK